MEDFTIIISSSIWLDLNLREDTLSHVKISMETSEAFRIKRGLGSTRVMTKAAKCALDPSWAESWLSHFVAEQ